MTESEILTKKTTLDHSISMTESSVDISENPAKATKKLDDATINKSEELLTIGVSLGRLDNAQAIKIPEQPKERTIAVGCKERLADLFSVTPISLKGDDLRLRIDYLTHVFLRLLGSEIEGREIRLGVLIGPPPEAGAAATSAEEFELSDDEHQALTDPLIAAKVYRDRIVGWADGDVGQSFVMLSSTGRILGLYRIAPVNWWPVDAHDQYRILTADQRYTAVWLKPASTARIYSQSKYVAQIIKLRDGLGWSIRRIDSLATLLIGVLERKFRQMIPDKLAWRIVELFCDLSEARSGGSLYIVKDHDAFYSMAHLLTGQEQTAPQSRNPVSISSFKAELNHMPITEWSIDALSRRLCQDGALVVTTEGILLASHTYFVGPGGRRQIARYVCRNPNEIVGMVVSQDGPIFLAGASERSEGASSELLAVDAERFL